LRLLCVAALVPRKGHDVLLRALATVRDLPWHLVCAGPRERNPVWARNLIHLRDAVGLVDRVTFAGALADGELEQLYAGADLFVLATRFEGYGMVFGEALARGLPILATRAGAVPHTLAPEAGLLVEPDDTDALAAALRALLADGELRRRLARGARAAGRRLPTWAQAATAFAAACAEAPGG
jgi:glycosyltransferase involved in cell wall biosynthesis